jgi:hypothetical protein
MPPPPWRLARRGQVRIAIILDKSMRAQFPGWSLFSRAERLHSPPSGDPGHFQRQRLFSRSNKPAGEKGIAFVHIPKTAGTWFTGFLARHFPEGAIAPPLYGHTSQSAFMDPEKQLFCGHFVYSQARVASGRLLFVTFLRDPVQRTISQYRSLHNPANFSKAWRDTIATEEATAIEWCQSASFDSFVRSDNPLILGHVKDVQTRYLSSFPLDDHEAFLSSAIDNLQNNFLFFGMQELSQSSLSLFRFQTGSSLQWNPSPGEKNQSLDYDASLSKAGQERLEDLIRNDQALYRAGRKLFDQRIAQVLAEAM